MCEKFRTWLGRGFVSFEYPDDAETSIDSLYEYLLTNFGDRSNIVLIASCKSRCHYKKNPEQQEFNQIDNSGINNNGDNESISSLLEWYRALNLSNSLTKSSKPSLVSTPELCQSYDAFKKASPSQYSIIMSPRLFDQYDYFNSNSESIWDLRQLLSCHYGKI